MAKKRKQQPPPTDGRPYTPPFIGEHKTNSIPPNIPCPKCDGEALISTIEDHRDGSAIVVYLRALCGCGVQLEATGEDAGDLDAAEKIALEHLRVQYRSRKNVR